MNVRLWLSGGPHYSEHLLARKTSGEIRGDDGRTRSEEHLRIRRAPIGEVCIHGPVDQERLSIPQDETCMVPTPGRQQSPSS